MIIQGFKYQLYHSIFKIVFNKFWAPICHTCYGWFWQQRILSQFGSSSPNFRKARSSDLNLELRNIRTTPFSRKNYNFDIAALFRHIYGEGKSAAISKLDFFSEWSRSYNALALSYRSKMTSIYTDRCIFPIAKIGFPNYCIIPWDKKFCMQNCLLKKYLRKSESP